MPELDEDAPVVFVHAVGDLAPARDLLFRIDAGRVLITLVCCETWLASVISRPADARCPYYSTASELGTMLGGTARLRVKGAITRRLSVIGPSL
jgi:hypothetical protein